MMYRGITEATAAFLWDLTFHNERAWFNEHKTEYLRLVKEPFDALAWQTCDELSALLPERRYLLHVSRIYRDARRLFGRGPYKDHLWFTLRQDQVESDNVSFWFELGKDGYAYGLGFYLPPAGMEEYRRAVLKNPGPLTRLAEAVEEQKKFALHPALYKRKKVETSPQLDPWLNCKSLSLVYRADYDAALEDPNFPARLAEAFLWLTPYHDYFSRFDRPAARTYPSESVKNQMK